MKHGRFQCIAEMLGAQLINKKADLDLPIFGCATTGIEWQFIKLQGNTVYLDDGTYSPTNLPQLYTAVCTIVSSIIGVVE